MKESLIKMAGMSNIDILILPLNILGINIFNEKGRMKMKTFLLLIFIEIWITSVNISYISLVFKKNFDFIELLTHTMTISWYMIISSIVPLSLITYKATYKLIKHLRKIDQLIKINFKKIAKECMLEVIGVILIISTTFICNATLSLQYSLSLNMLNGTFIGCLSAIHFSLITLVLCFVVKYLKEVEKIAVICLAKCIFKNSDQYGNLKYRKSFQGEVNIKIFKDCFYDSFTRLKDRSFQCAKIEKLLLKVNQCLNYVMQSLGLLILNHFIMTCVVITCALFYIIHHSEEGRYDMMNDSFCFISVMLLQNNVSHYFNKKVRFF